MVSSLRHGWIPAAFAALVALSPASALAAPTPKDKADSKEEYSKARAAVLAGQHAEAVKSFKRADELDPNPQYRLEMAQSLVAGGKLIEASGELNALINANPPVIWSVKSAAQKTLSEIEPRIPWVQIKIIGPETSLTSTTIDGKEIDAENEVPWNPGEYTVSADADGYEPAEKKFTLAEGAHEVVELKLKRSKGASSKRKSAATPDDSDKDVSTNSNSSDSSSKGKSLGEITQAPLFIPMAVAGGVGVVGLGLGTVFGVMALSETATAKESCEGNICPDTVRVRRARDAALVNGNVSTAMFVVGGAGLAAGGVLLYLTLTQSSPPPAKKEQAFVRPWVSAGQAGVYGAF